MNNVDLVAAKKLDISVYNTLGPTQSVEITVASLLSLLRKIPQANNDLHNGKWKSLCNFLYQKEILFIGYGNIAKKVHDLIRPFDVCNYVYDPFIKNDFSLDVHFYSDLIMFHPK